MKNFLLNRSYEMVRMFLNQFATAIFGVVLAIAAGKAENVVLRNVTSAFAILFYLFLLYTMTWELGFKDKAAVDNGRKESAPLTGLWLSLCANTINFFFAIFISLASFVNLEALNNFGAFCSAAALLLEGMFTGLLANTVGGAPLNSHWWIYFLLPIPAMITCTVSYYFGLKDIKFTSLFDVQYPESDREPKKKK